MFQILNTYISYFLGEFCGKGFNEKRFLEDHTNIHTGNKPHECNLCGNRYANRANMAAHIRTTHKGIKRVKQ